MKLSSVKNSNVLALLVLSTFLFQGVLAKEYEGTKQGATDFVQHIGDEVVSLLDRSNNRSRDEKRAILINTFADTIDLRPAVKKIMGSAFKPSSTSQKKRFLKVLNESLISNYSGVLLDFEVKSMHIKDVRFKDGKSPRALALVKVETNVIEAEVVYYLRYSKGEWKLYNFAFNGSDISKIMGTIFYSAYLSNNKDIDKVIDQWEVLMASN